MSVRQAWLGTPTARPGAEPDLRERKRRYLGEQYADDPLGLARFYHAQEAERYPNTPPFAEWRAEQERNR